MSVTQRHTLYGVLFDATLVGGINAQRISTGTEVRMEPTGGEVYARFGAVTARKPSATFTTLAIAAALDQAALTGKKIADLSAGLTLYAHAHAIGSTRAGAGGHRKYAIAAGLVYPQTLRCDHNGDASIDYEAVPTAVGGNDPIIESDGVSMPAGLDDAERFGLGPVTIESQTLTHCRSFELAFGIIVEAIGSDGDLAPTFVSIVRIQPIITLRGIDVEWMKSTVIPRAGVVATHANTAIYLRKRSGTSFVANGTAQHVKFTAAGIAYIDGALEASGDDEAETSLVMPCEYDGTNDPLVIDTSSAIT